MTLTKAWRAAAAAALMIAGLLLFWRPLTGLAVLVPVVLVAAAAWLWFRAIETRTPLRIAIAAVGSGAALAGIVFVRLTIMAVPAAVALALAAGSGLLLARAVRGTGLRRAGDALGAVSAFGGAWLALVWPDAALVAVSSIAWLAAVVAGVAILVGTLRGKRPHTPLAVKVVAAALACAVAIAAVGASVFLRSATPVTSGFYHWSGPIPREGTLLRVQGYQGQSPSGAKALTILYATSHADGTPAVASAVVAVPQSPAPAGGRQILAWQHGTTGVSQPCAPSLTSGALSEAAIPGIGEAIGRGWLVVATDYAGMGTTGRYPYLIGQGEARSTLDAVRAARTLDDAGASDKVWLWGHSQGGHATLWAGEIAADYAPELTVLGVAALSSASDPLALAERILGQGLVASLATAWVLVPYADEYPDVSVGDQVHPAGETLALQAAQRCATDRSLLVSVLAALAIRADAPLYHIDLSEGPVRTRLVENAATGVVPAPLFLGQGDADETVPVGIQRTLNAQLCSAGRTVVAHEYQGRSHMGVLDPSSGLTRDMFAWVDEVLAGQSPSTCP